MSIPKQVSDYMAKIGRKGGKSKSERKKKAVAKNAKNGGWDLYWRRRRANGKHNED
jgi:hypothetical protein